MKLTARQIFEKHIGTNQELGYIPIKNEDVMNAINEALSQHDVIKNEVAVCDCEVKGAYEEWTVRICKECDKEQI